ncbi:hypothetical protein Tco_0945885 [Tanacetum coccineum]
MSLAESKAASVGFERGLSMHQTKDEFVNVLKKMANFLPGAQDRLAEASLLVAQTDYAFLNKISKHATEPLSVILQLEPEKLACLANVPFKGCSCFYSYCKGVDCDTCFQILGVWVNAMVDGPDAEMNDGAAHSKSKSVFVQGTSHVLVDVAKVTVVGLERVSSGLTDVVVALSTGEKGDGSLPSSAVDEEAAANPFRV